MAKNRFIFISICILFWLPTSSLDRTCLDKTMTSQLYVRELTGHNDGVEVEMFQKATGNKRGDSWCASFIAWVYNKCGIRHNINGWAPSAHNKNHVIASQGRIWEEPLVGDVFSIYSVSQKRIVHVGFYYRYYNSRIFESVEGNTNTDGSSNGNGVYKRKRSYNMVYSITRWP